MTLKHIAISVGLYGPARALHRFLHKAERDRFRTGLAFYQQFIRHGDLCFDIGGNIGEKTEIFLALGATVVSLEPQKDLAEEIEARAKKYRKRCVVLPCAVGAEKGTATLNLKKESTGQASLRSNWQGTTVASLQVSVITLDELIAKYGKPQFTKIDVEGAEPQVLRGLSQPLPSLSIEYHCDAPGVELIRECFSLIHGNVEVNATGPEADGLLLHRWLPADEFLAGFPENVSSHFFGDLIIRQAARSKSN